MLRNSNEIGIYKIQKMMPVTLIILNESTNNMINIADTFIILNESIDNMINIADTFIILNESTDNMITIADYNYQYQPHWYHSYSHQ